MPSLAFYYFFLLVIFFLFTSFVFHFNFKLVVVLAAPFDDIVASLHLAVDTVVSHFVSVVVSLCFSLKNNTFFLPLQ